MTDTDRINWLESGGGETDVFIDRDPKSGIPYAIRLWPKLGPGPQFNGNTLREAIDFAISSSSQPSA